MSLYGVISESDDIEANDTPLERESKDSHKKKERPMGTYMYHYTKITIVRVCVCVCVCVCERAGGH